MFAKLRTVKSSGNLSNHADRGCIPVDGVGAGGGIRTHVAQRTTGFQVDFSRLKLHDACMHDLLHTWFPAHLCYAL